MHNTGVLNEGPNTTIPGMDLTKAALANFHSPVIYILGGPPDIAYKNGMDDFERIVGVPVAVANLPVGHGGTFQEPNGGAAASVAVSWLDWRVRGDASAARRFVGDDCGLVPRRDLDLSTKKLWTRRRSRAVAAEPYVEVRTMTPIKTALIFVALGATAAVSAPAPPKSPSSRPPIPKRCSPTKTQR